MEINELKQNLEPALKHIDLLCQGYCIQVIPEYRSILNKVCDQINTKKSWREDIDEILFLLKKDSRSIKAYHYDMAKQFKDKFLNIAKYEILPQLKLFCAKNPDIALEDFRPLFEIRISKG
jgi:hypothetical protein